MTRRFIPIKLMTREWDAEFAALLPGQVLAPDRLEAWKAVVEEMRMEPTGPSLADIIEAGV